MAEKPSPFDEMMAAWKEGQSAFMAAQAEMMAGAQKVMGEVFGEKPKAEETDPMEAWAAFAQSWIPNGFADKGREAWYSLIDPATWVKTSPEQLQALFQSFASGPKFADMATPHQDLAASWQELMALQQASLEYGTVMQKAWSDAYKAFSDSEGAEHLAAGDMKAAMNAWLKIANAHLLQTQASQPFLDAQKALLRANLKVKQRQVAMAQTWCEQYQIPSRQEMDDLIATVHKLRQEVRELKAQNKTDKRS